jgi:uroporphyrinogen-III synthase
MPDYTTNILSTRPLEAGILQQAMAAGINIEVAAFIETSPVRNDHLKAIIESSFTQPETVIFTSMNAVEAVADYKAGKQPEWKIYAIGYTTRELIARYFGENSIAGTADNAAALALLIASEESNKNSRIRFFCGDRRRDELPDILKQNNIELEEIVVYETHTLTQAINKVYEGILFFSPSAVDSFFAVNTMPASTVLFAIGNTTADTIKQYCNNPVVISHQPGKNELVHQAITYFS